MRIDNKAKAMVKIYKNTIIRYFWDDGEWYSGTVIAKYVDGNYQLKFDDGFILDKLSESKHNPPNENGKFDRPPQTYDWYIEGIHVEQKMYNECHNDEDPIQLEKWADLNEDAIIKFERGSVIYCYDVRSLYQWAIEEGKGTDPLTGKEFSTKELALIIEKHKDFK
jgi:hypothetical protein